MTASPTECDVAVYRWLRECFSEQPELPSVSSLQPRLLTSTSLAGRKRTRDMSGHRSRSPQKRQRTVPDDGEWSTSEVALTELSDRTRLSRPSLAGRSRATSPVRDLMNDLRVSKPAIMCEIPSAVMLPELASNLQRDLMERLEEAIIPLGLKDRILTKYPSVAPSIPSSAYDTSNALSASELDTLWDSVEEILMESKDCGTYQQDENAWCIKVVHPVLRLALKRSSALKVESVQTQTINPDVLPVTPKNYRVQRKADFTFSFDRNAPEVSRLYSRLNLAGLSETISQTMDANTKRLALFSGIEVKQENGGKDEALVQLAIWLAAGLESLRRLGELGQKRPYMAQELCPTVGWTVIGHDWHTYIAYMATQDGQNSFTVVGPWRVAAADTRDVFGVFKLLRLVENAAGFALEGYWEWLRDEVLMPCTSLSA